MLLQKLIVPAGAAGELNHIVALVLVLENLQSYRFFEPLPSVAVFDSDLKLGNTMQPKTEQVDPLLDAGARPFSQMMSHLASGEVEL